MAVYDPSILQRFADDLYARARWLQLKYGFYGFAISFCALALLGPLLSRSAHDSDSTLGVWMLILLAVGVVGGIAIGREKAFHLKLEAQRLLCQLQIERNTHRTAEP